VEYGIPALEELVKVPVADEAGRGMFIDQPHRLSLARDHDTSMPQARIVSAISLMSTSNSRVLSGIPEIATG